MSKRNMTDMLDELKNRGFTSQKYDYEIVKNKDNKKKRVIINAPLINIYGRKIEGLISDLLTDELLATFKINQYKNICAVGLGNREVLIDALGPKVLQKILVTRGLEIEPQLSVIYPNVYSQTGIESADLITSICKEIKPDLVILIDSLATTSLDRLGSSFQVTKEGIQAGSGLNNNNKKMTYKNLGCDVISIGVPMMIYAQNLFKNVEKKQNLKDVILTPCDSGKVVNLLSDIIADAINLAIFPQFSKQEINIMKN